MRLHRVAVSAFGPFAGTEVVDVDALAAEGLFLLHGPTGAGKTSVLDAVCFALYGRVPGARGGGQPTLRSHHAADGAAPGVVCEVSLGERRFEVTRSPAWERPKRRGAGTTTEQARMVLREHRDGAWQAVSARTDEASQVLTDALGMGLEQFTKVVLLPQGEFAAFLRAGEAERRPLLQRLFGTDRFAAVEAWLAAERRRLRAEVEAADVALDRLLARGEQAAAQLPAAADPLPGEHDPPARGTTDWPAWVLRQLRALAAHADAVAATARLRERAARAEVGTARDALRAAEAAQQRAAALAAATARLRALQECSDAVAADDGRVQAARRAAAVAGHLDGARHAAERARAASVARRQAHAAAAELLDGVGAVDGGPAPAPDDLATTAAALREQAGRLAELVAAEAAHTRRQQELADTRTAAAAAGERLEQVREQVAALSGEVAALDARAAALAPVAAGAERASDAVARAEAVLAAAGEADERRARLEVLADAERAATDTAQAARTAWLDLRQARLDGIAAELAATLTDGHPCPVCGSPEHPAPVPPGAGVAGAEAEQAAEAACERADAERDAAAGLRGEQERALAAAVGASAGTDAAAAAAVLDAARTSSVAAASAAAEQAQVVSQRAQLAQRATAAGEELAELQPQRVALTALAERLAREVEAEEARLAAARGDDPSLAARAQRLGRSATAAERLAAALLAEVEAVGAAERASVAADDAARSAGFPTAADAAAAALPPHDLTALADAVAEHASAVRAATERLAEPDLVRAAAEATAAAEGVDGTVAGDGSAEVARLAEGLAHAEAEVDAAAAAATTAGGAVDALAAVLAQAEAAVADASPLRERALLVADLASCADATGGGNARRMTLSTFVLAARLEQVAAAATVRLRSMSDGRYALVHTDALERRGARSGLGLRVLDFWTGQQRDTATLSGGETFLASLALALGLADVVQAEAGGTAIETLFVDEGFGTLDPETLEEVMAVLEQLRAGGRAVGLVSHVPDLRDRVPARLEVVKTPAGSSLRTHLTGAAAR